MRLVRDDVKAKAPTGKVELEMDKSLIEQLQVMEEFTKIPKGEIVATALKRFISSHKDYFPEGYSPR